MNRNNVSTIMDVLWYLILFVILQTACMYLTTFVGTHVDWLNQADQVISASLLSGMLTIIIFAWRQYSPLTKTYLRSRPWAQLIWICFFALGTILPLQWLYEQMDLQMPEEYKNLFNLIMGSPYGFITVGVIIPAVEEMVFRGAVLRRMLKGWNVSPWIPITISALIFGLVHFNLPQGIHAFLIGLFLGWMYHKTGSIVPGYAFHLVNNTVVYVVNKLMPGMEDGKLIEFFNGNHTTMMLGLLFSLLIAVPAFLQILMSLRKSRQ